MGISRIHEDFMRRIILSVSTVIAAGLAGLSPAYAQGADANSYRPGQPYLSQSVPVPEACMSQCNGDAACQGWNFIPLQNRSGGICELNSESVSPMPHPVAFSGRSLQARQAGSVIATTSRMKVNTRRIGEPYVARKPLQNSAPAPQTRKIQRRTSAVPQRSPNMNRAVQRRQQPQSQPQPALRPQTQQQAQPLNRGHINTAPQRPLTQPSPMRQAVPPQMPRGRAIPAQNNQVPNLQSQNRPAQGRQMPAVDPRAQVPLRRPNAAMTPPAPQQRAPQAALRPAPAQTPLQRPRPQQPQQLQQQPLATLSDFENSLYGSLRDDEHPEKKRVPIPQNPDAPISAFSIPAPSGTVTKSELAPAAPMTTGPELAGGPGG